MSEIQRMTYQDETGKTYEIFIETKSIQIDEVKSGERQGKGGDSGNSAVQLQQATDMIRGYASYALSAFKNFSAAKVEEVTLSFGLKIGGKVGIPYITEGSTESNLSIQVKCKYPD